MKIHSIYVKFDSFDESHFERDGEPPEPNARFFIEPAYAVWRPYEFGIIGNGRTQQEAREAVEKFFTDKIRSGIPYPKNVP